MKYTERFLAHFDSEQTRRAYTYDLEQFFQFLGRSPSDTVDSMALDRSDLQSFVNEMREKDLSVATQRRRVSAVRRFFDWLRERGAIAHNPIQGQVEFREQNPTPMSDSEPFLTRDALQSVLDTLERDTGRGRRDYALVSLIVFAALRRSEAAVLDVKDVRPLGRHWIVDLSPSGRGHGGYVPIPDEVAAAVQELVDTYESGEGPLWRSLSPQNRGARLSPDALYKTVRRAGRKANVEGLTIERLRQSGLRLASKGGATVDELRRHARLRTAASAVRYCTESESSRLSSQVGNCIALDL